MMNNTINNVSVNTLSRPWSHLKENYNFSLEELALFEEEHNGLNPDQFYHIYHSFADNFVDLLSDLPNTILDTRFEFSEKKVEREYPSVFLVYEVYGGIDMREYCEEYEETRTLRGAFLNRKSAEKYVEKFNIKETVSSYYFTKTYNKLEIVEEKLISTEDFDECDDLGYSARPWDNILDFAETGYIYIEDLPSRRILSELLKARGIKLTEYGLERMLVHNFFCETYVKRYEEDFDWDEFYKNQPDYSFDPYDPHRTDSSMDVAIYMFFETFNIPQEHREQYKRIIKNNPENRKMLMSKIGFICQLFLMVVIQ